MCRIISIINSTGSDTIELFIKTRCGMDKIQNTRKSAASVSKKDILEIIVLTFLVVIWAFIGL